MKKNQEIELDNINLEAERIANWLSKTNENLSLNLVDFIALLLIDSSNQMNVFEMIGILDEVKDRLKEAAKNIEEE